MTVQAEPNTNQKRFQDPSCSNLFQALSHSTASHKTSVKYVVSGLLLHLQGTPKSTKIDAKMLSEPSCNKCSKLRPNCTAYPETLVKHGFRGLFRSPAHPKSIEKWLQDLSQAGFSEGHRSRSIWSWILWADGFKNRPSSTTNHKTYALQLIC